jgi:predicted RecB family nuclease
MPPRITREVVEAFLPCRTRGFLRLSGQRGVPSDYEALLVEARERTRQVGLHRILPCPAPSDVACDVLLDLPLLRQGPSLIVDATLEDDVFSVRLDGLKRVEGVSALGGFHYVPVLFHGEREVRREQRLLLEVQGHLLGLLQGRAPGHAVVWRGREARGTKVRLGTAPRTTEQVLRSLQELANAQPPRLVLNDHCQHCEFRQRCRQQAVEEDNLTLLRGMKEKEIRLTSWRSAPCSRSSSGYACTAARC